jgi:hypothetical protein
MLFLGHVARAETAAAAGKSFTHFESFESVIENTPSDPRDLNGNGIIDCGPDNNCDTVTSCNRRNRSMCDEWTIALAADANLRLSSEAPTENSVYFKSLTGAALPPERGFAEIIGAGSTLTCPDPPDLEPLPLRDDLLDWHVHTEKTPDIDGIDTTRPGTLPKAKRGRNSLHWGRHVRYTPEKPVRNQRFGDAYCLRCLNAFVLDRPGGLTLGATSSQSQPLRLSFWHIAEFCDEECFFGYEGHSAKEMGIVEVRVDADSSPAVAYGPWTRLEPELNPYDGQVDTFYGTPIYEPPDDVNPTGIPDAATTVCLPLLSYAAQGSAKGVDAQNCSDGDGNGSGDCGFAATTGVGFTSRGEAGVGVWVHTAFDLLPYAGQRVQFRFLAVTSDGEDFFTSYLEPTVEAFIRPEASYDDGWYVDDIRVSGLVPATQ